MAPYRLGTLQQLQIGQSAMIEVIYPRTLADALSSKLILPGSRLLLRGGTYTGDFVNRLSGVTIQSYPGEWAVIDGSFEIGGEDVTVRDMEICYTGWTTRETEIAGSSPADMPTQNLKCNAPRAKLINLYIHDLAECGLWIPSTDAEMYGCLVRSIGWRGPDRGHGHALYTQSESTKLIRNNIFCDCFGWGIHAYSGTSGSKLRGITIDNNVCFGAGSANSAQYQNILLGADGSQVDGGVISNNKTYGAAGIGFYGAGAALDALTENYCPDGVYGTYTATVESGNNWDTVGNQVFLTPNAYDASRATLTIYNADNADDVSVDVSSLGWTGQVRVRNAQDYFGDVQTLDITGNHVSVSMAAGNRTVAAPVEWTAPASTYPKFGCFVVERIN